MRKAAFNEYNLSKLSLDKLAEIKNRIDKNNKNVKLWKNISGEFQAEEKDDEQNEEPEAEMSEISHNDSMVVASQFYFSQSNSFHSSNTSMTKAQTLNQVAEIDTIKKNLKETLENSKGYLDLDSLQNLSTTEVADILDILGKDLSMVGLLNVLKRMCEFDMEEKMKYFDIVSAKLVLNKLCEIEKSDFTITKNLEKLTILFPDEVRKWIFIPILNCNLKDYSFILLNIINHLNTEKNTLLMDFTSHSNEIKEWHIPLIQQLISTSIEESVKSQLVKMFLDKCTQFADNKNFGKLIAAFIPAGTPFSKVDIQILNEIADVHKTPLKRSMNAAIKNLRLY